MTQVAIIAAQMSNEEIEAKIGKAVRLRAAGCCESTKCVTRAKILAEVGTEIHIIDPSKKATAKNALALCPNCRALARKQQAYTSEVAAPVAAKVVKVAKVATPKIVAVTDEVEEVDADALTAEEARRLRRNQASRDCRARQRAAALAAA